MGSGAARQVDEQVRKHLRNAGWSGLASALRAGSGLVNSLLAVRLIGVSGYGHLATLLSLFVLYLSLNSSVFTVLVVKLMRPAQESDDSTRADLIAAAATFAGGSLAVLAALTVLLSVFGPHLLSTDAAGAAAPGGIREAIAFMGVLTAIQILVSLQSALVESAGRLDLAMKCQLFGPLIVLAALAVDFGFGRPVTASGYVLLLSAGAAVDLTFTSLARRAVSPGANLLCASPRRLAVLGGLLRSGGVLQATSLMNMFLEPLNKVLLNQFAGATGVTVYDLAMKVIWGIQTLFGATMRVFLHIGSQDREAVGRGFFQTVNLLAVPVVVFHAAGAVFVFWVAHYWLSVDGDLMLAFFAIATISNLAMIGITPLYVSLIGRNDLGFVFRTQAILAVTNILVSLVLIPSLGVIGSAFGLLAATAYNAGAIYRRCRRDARSWPGAWGSLRPGRWRYVAAIGLFLAVLWWTFSGGENLEALGPLVLCLFVLVAREPIIVILAGRIWPRKQ